VAQNAKPPRVISIARALLSVSDKTGLVDLGQRLERLGVELISTGGTASALRGAGVLVREIGDFTGAPPMLDGRVKTLHPRVFGGILGRDTEEHRGQMRSAGIERIDLVVVNLYPFRETVARGARFEEVIENIDIGGPSLIRAAAKNHERVTVMVDPADYDRVLRELEEHREVSGGLRFELACKAFAFTASYDGAVANYLGRLDSPTAPPGELGRSLNLDFRLSRLLRYGENPHQRAAFYSGDRTSGPSLARAEVLQGKELSYNNLLDLDAATKLCAEFLQPAVVIVKHTNPCGVAISAEGVLKAYRRAREADPGSAFGGIVAVNRAVDADLAKEMAETFLECIIAPDFTPAALGLFAARKGLRLLRGQIAGGEKGALEFRTVAGGVLVQTCDASTREVSQGKVVSRRSPSAGELADLEFAWRVAKHVKSNAIVFAGGGATLGIGAGQMSRVDSVRIAVSKSRSSLDGSVVASDAFFPFRDGVDEAAKAGATAIAEPGGSVRDQEVIAAADERDLALVFTGERHFRH
jgi:phosphoribosylaminoimidazolecarboxamide formyltransferase/IMP cyclohydrolase